MLNIKEHLIKERSSAASAASANSTSYERLNNIPLNRTNFKRAIMTKPYNASPWSAYGAIQDSFKLKVIDEVNWYYNEGDDVNLINDKDLRILHKIFIKYLTTHFNRIKTLSKYLEDVANICTTLKIPIV